LRQAHALPPAAMLGVRRRLLQLLSWHRTPASAVGGGGGASAFCMDGAQLAAAVGAMGALSRCRRAPLGAGDADELVMWVAAAAPALAAWRRGGGLVAASGSGSEGGAVAQVPGPGGEALGDEEVAGRARPCLLLSVLRALRRMRVHPRRHALAAALHSVAATAGSATAAARGSGGRWPAAGAAAVPRACDGGAWSRRVRAALDRWLLVLRANERVLTLRRCRRLHLPVLAHGVSARPLRAPNVPRKKLESGGAKMHVRQPRSGCL
jgi:hypothetical protein